VAQDLSDQMLLDHEVKIIGATVLSIAFHSDPGSRNRHD
jgi:hypothetical protein